MNIGIQIKRLRKSKGVNQKTFASYLGITPIHYCAIEGGKQVTTIKMLEKIAHETNTQLVITFIDKE